MLCDFGRVAVNAIGHRLIAKPPIMYDINYKVSIHTAGRLSFIQYLTMHTVGVGVRVSVSVRVRVWPCA